MKNLPITLEDEPTRLEDTMHMLIGVFACLGLVAFIAAIAFATGWLVQKLA